MTTFCATYNSRMNSTTLVVIGTNCTGSCKSNYHTITTTMVPQQRLQCAFSLFVLKSTPSGLLLYNLTTPQHLLSATHRDVLAPRHLLSTTHRDVLAPRHLLSATHRDVLAPRHLLSTTHRDVLAPRHLLPPHIGTCWHHGISFPPHIGTCWHHSISFPPHIGTCWQICRLSTGNC